MNMNRPGKPEVVPARVHWQGILASRRQFPIVGQTFLSAGSGDFPVASPKRACRARSTGQECPGNRQTGMSALQRRRANFQRNRGLAARAATRCLFAVCCLFFCAASAADLPPGKFQNPINPGPDPWMDFFEGNYYLTTTQGDAIRMWKSPTVAGLKTAPPVTVWRDSAPTRSRGMWAPEFHFITNRWYLYYTATSQDNNDDNHRLHVLESAGRDPLGPYTYKARLFNPTNDQYAIDASVFQKASDGSWYCVWAARPGHVLYIARLANPWTIAGNAVYRPASGFDCAEVREGPVVLRHQGRLFLVYSACDTGKPDYKLGLLTADEKADLLDPKSWKQYPRPVFERSDASGVFGPGHNGFFRSPDGAEDWIVYHGKTSSAYTYRGRTTRVQKINWRADGTLDFGVPLPLDALLEEPSDRAK